VSGTGAGRGSGRTVLVTGGAGFIGSHFVAQHLASRPHDRVIVLDALTYAGRIERIPADVRESARFEFVHGNVRSPGVVESLVGRADVIVHFAAETHVPRSISDGTIFMETDILGTHTLASAAVRYASRIERFVHISTSEVYGSAQAETMDEEHPLAPRTPYAAAKCGADRLVHACGLTYGLPTVILRPFNNYGPAQHLEKLVPRLVTGALLGEKLTVHGDGSASRDWLHVADTCRAVEAALDAPLERVRGEAINIGTGRDASVLDLARRIVALTGRDESLIVHTADRPGQVDTQRCATAKAAERLGFEAHIGLDEGLAKTVDWYRANRDDWESMRWMRAVPVMDSRGRVTWW
jgi:dTDP-glucose 4,6-dehydratase